jgi:hypothetical protein
MTTPTPYDLAYSFQAYQISNPARPLPADKIEAEFNALTITTDEIIANLGLIQRADGELGNGVVGYDQLDPSLYTGFRQPNPWVTSTAYIAYDAVYQDNCLYRCIVAHTSGTFATDLLAGKWELLIELTAGASVVSFNGRGGVVVPLVGDYSAFFQPLDADLTALAALPTTAYGRGLLNMANAAALAAEVDSAFLTPAEGNAAYQPLDVDLTAIAALTTTATGRGLLAIANAAAGRTILDAAATGQTDFISGLIPTVADGAYKIVQKIPFGCTITALVTRCTSGTCTLTGSINATPFGGTANAVSTSEVSQAQASANVVVTDDDITLTASANSTCLNLSFTIVFTKVLA